MNSFVHRIRLRSHTICYLLMHMIPAIVIVSVVVETQQSQISAEQFAAFDDAGKRAALNDIAASRSQLPIGTVVGLVRMGVKHEAPEVRVASMTAVAGRALAARWAGTTGPGVGPSSPHMPRSTPKLIPAEWRTDRETLRRGLFDACLALLRYDTDERVRHSALLAIGNLEVPADVEQPIGEEFVSLLIDVYGRDPSGGIRAEVVKTFRLASNNSDRIRIVLRDALIDRASSVRHEALTALESAAVGGVPKLAFADARSTILAGIKDGDPAVRLSAVQALNLFGASARDQLPLLEQLSGSDPDLRVRNSARLAIEAIRRDLTQTAPGGR